MAAASTPETAVLAVYGLQIAGLSELSGTGPAAPDDWPAWTVNRRVGHTDDSEGWMVWTQRARIGMPGSGEILIDREAQEITFATKAPLSAQALLHPGLVPPAAIVSFWHGRACMHASAVVIGGRVWALLADRDGGKSTTAALLADRGCALFTDDMLILDGLECFAGPASVDLRAEAAGRLGGASLGVVGNRERWRKAFPVGVLQAPLGGWIELAWSDELVSVDPIEAVADRLALLDRHKSLPMNGEQILDLATVPMFRWSRPRSLGAAGEAVDALIAATV